MIPIAITLEIWPICCHCKTLNAQDVIMSGDRVVLVSIDLAPQVLHGVLKDNVLRSYVKGVLITKAGGLHSSIEQNIKNACFEVFAIL